MDPTNTCDLPPQAGRYDYACLGRVWALSLKNNPLPHFFFFFLKELSALEKKIPTSQETGSGEEERLSANTPPCAPEPPWWGPV